MKYLLLIYADPAAQAAAPEEATREMYRAYGVFTAELAASGKLGAAEELEAPASAKSVRIREGRTIVTDGPFAEVREQLGGFYVIEAADIDEAISWAARVPSAGHGTIEVRPIAQGEYPELD